MPTRALGARRAPQLLTRLLDTPDLARVVQTLEPRALHRLVRACGLEDCGEIVALASTEQLVRVFDDDLWRSDAPGEEERFDAGRFGLWLEVLAGVDVALAARKLVEMDLDFVAAALTRHVLVLGPGAPGGRAAEEAGIEEPDPDEAARAARVEQALEDGVAYDFAGYQVVARSGESWDALLAVLVALDADHHAFFTRLLRRCHRISVESLDDRGGLDGILDAQEQVLADVAADRERRRQEEGYVPPSDAAAFLELARRSPHAREGAVPHRDPVSAAWFRERKAGAKRQGPRGRAKPEARDGEPVARHAASFVATLQQAGVLPKARPRLLLEGPGDSGSRLARLRAQLLFVQEHDSAVHSERLEEVAYSRTSWSRGAPSGRGAFGPSRRPTPCSPPATSGWRTGPPAAPRSRPGSCFGRTSWRSSGLGGASCTRGSDCAWRGASRRRSPSCPATTTSCRPTSPS